MSNSTITFRKIIFIIEDGITHCEVRWDTTDPILCGYGAKKSFPKETTCEDILKEFGSILVDSSWTPIR